MKSMIAPPLGGQYPYQVPGPAGPQMLMAAPVSNTGHPGKCPLRKRQYALVVHYICLSRRVTAVQEIGEEVQGVISSARRYRLPVLPDHHASSPTVHAAKRAGIAVPSNASTFCAPGCHTHTDTGAYSGSLQSSSPHHLAGDREDLFYRSSLNYLAGLQLRFAPVII